MARANRHLELSVALVRLAAALTVTGALIAGCSTDPAPPAPPPPAVRLDGSPRIPDDEGVATGLDRDSITLDGARTYRVSDELRSFSTYTGELEPMLGRKSQYVQIGVRGDEMVWMAGIAEVVDVDGVPSVFYTGRFVSSSGGRFVFADGSTFEPAPGVEAPGTERPVTVRIEVSRRQIAEITA